MISFLISIAFYVIIGVVFWKFGMLKQRYMEPLFMWISIFGIFTLSEPWIFHLYRYGFAILLTGTAVYIFAIHLK